MDKDKLSELVLRKDGKLNSAVLRQRWFLDSEEYKEILEETNFLENVAIKERIWCILNDIHQQQRCIICNHPAVFLPSFGNGYSKTCSSRKCIQSVNETREKRNKTLMEKHGALVSEKTRIAARNRSSELFEKGRQALYERYGVNNPSHLDTHKEKVRETLVERYGVERIYDIPKKKQQISEKRLQRFSEFGKNFGVVKSVKKRVNDSRQLFNISFVCKKCHKQSELFGETFLWRVKNNISPCSDCSGIKHGSSGQLQIFEFITSLGIDAEYNNRTILNGQELDIYVPEFKMAFEYDGLFWHSFNYKESTEERNRHLTKTKMCKELGITLIHIFENEWINNREIVCSRIKSFLGMNERIYARKCTVSELSSNDAKIFLDRCHIQSSKIGINLGLYYEGRLVACMTFGRSRFDKNVEWEILRYSSELGINVVGGASKLLAYFKQRYEPKSIISYADKRWTIGKLYSKLGFDLVRVSQPSYYYFKSQHGLKLFNRVSFQKYKLKNILTDFDINLTESENMFNNGYRRIWDCGTDVWIWSGI